MLWCSGNAYRYADHTHPSAPTEDTVTAGNNEEEEEVYHSSQESDTSNSVEEGEEEEEEEQRNDGQEHGEGEKASEIRAHLLCTESRRPG